jgi:hypothetical protein
LDQYAWLYAIELREVYIQHDTESANQFDLIRDAVDYSFQFAFHAKDSRRPSRIREAE